MPNPHLLAESVLLSQRQALPAPTMPIRATVAHRKQGEGRTLLTSYYKPRLSCASRKRLDCSFPLAVACLAFCCLTPPCRAARQAFGWSSVASGHC